MEITESKRNGVAVFALHGRLDASNAGTVEHKLLALIDGGETCIVVDCAQLDYISSAGLRVLLVAVKRSHARHGTIAIAALKDQIREVFDIAGFASIFSIYDTPDEAIVAAKEGEKAKEER
jgi:anti-sigma B factor antagonist